MACGRGGLSWIRTKKTVVGTIDQADVWQAVAGGAETESLPCSSLQYIFQSRFLQKPKSLSRKPRVTALNQTWHFAGWDGRKDKEVEGVGRMESICWQWHLRRTGEEAMLVSGKSWWMGREESSDIAAARRPTAKHGGSEGLWGQLEQVLRFPFMSPIVNILLEAWCPDLSILSQCAVRRAGQNRRPPPLG